MSVTLYLRHGDCVEVLKGYADASIGAVVSDPPYDLVGNKFSRNGSNQPGDMTTPYGRSGPSNARGFMGKTWDGTGIAFSDRLWDEVYRVLVPGGMVKAFSGSRTFHRMGAAMQRAGFTSLGVEAWAYGSGFPKSMSIGKALDRTAGKTTDDIRCLKRELQRVFALSNLTLVQLNEGCGFEASGYLRESSTWVNVLPSPEKWWRMREVIGCDAEFEFTFRAAERAVVGESPWSNSVNHFVPGENHKDRVRLLVTAPATETAQRWEGWGTALKPAWEPIIVGRKPE